MSFLAPTRPFLRTSTVSAGLSAAARQFSRLSMIGRITETPQPRTSAAGRDYFRYSIATTTSRNSPTSFFQIIDFSDDPKQKQYMAALPKGWVKRKKKKTME